MQVSASEWDACARGSGETNPFLLHAFLLALEESRSAVGPSFCFSLFSHAHVRRTSGVISKALTLIDERTAGRPVLASWYPLESDTWLSLRAVCQVH